MISRIIPSDIEVGSNRAALLLVSDKGDKREVSGDGGREFCFQRPSFYLGIYSIKRRPLFLAVKLLSFNGYYADN